jgi:hypothetical protein
VNVGLGQCELVTDVFSKFSRLTPGIEGEFFTQDGLGLRVTPLVSPDAIVFSTPGLRGLAFHRPDQICAPTELP